MPAIWLPAGPDAVHEFSRGYFEIAREQKLQTVAIVGADSDFAKKAADGAHDNATKMGFKIVYERSYPPSTVDFSPIVRAVQAANPDFVYVASYPTDTVGIVRAANEIGLKPKMFGGGMIGLAFWATVINYLDRQTLSVAAPVLQEKFHITDEAYGWVVSAFLGAYTIMNGASGPLIDRLGTKLGYGLCVAWWSVAAALHAESAECVDRLRGEPDVPHHRDAGRDQFLDLMRYPQAPFQLDRLRARLERHHWNYDEPLNVTFLCVDCHSLADAMAWGAETA